MRFVCIIGNKRVRSMCIVLVHRDVLLMKTYVKKFYYYYLLTILINLIIFLLIIIIITLTNK